MSIVIYKGVPIYARPDGWETCGTVFYSLTDAVRFIYIRLAVMLGVKD